MLSNESSAALVLLGDPAARRIGSTRVEAGRAVPWDERPPCGNGGPMSFLLVLGLAASMTAGPTRLAPAAPPPLAPAEIHALLTSPLRHVRALTPTLARVLEIGMQRSPTFARL